MYDFRPNLVLGFHGCDKSIANNLISNYSDIKKSEKPYDWLGHGMYFWENNLERAWEWANDKEEKGEIKEAAVVGAVINLGICLDLLDSKYLNIISAYYELMKANYQAINKPLPKNKDVSKDIYKNKLIRELDCATIEFIHEQIFSSYQKEIKENSGYTNIKLFDSTRGVFTEGGEAFPGSAIEKKSHIQICVRNLNCIKGFFLPRKEDDFIAILEEEYKRKQS